MSLGRFIFPSYDEASNRQKTDVSGITQDKQGHLKIVMIAQVSSQGSIIRDFKVTL